MDPHKGRCVADVVVWTGQLPTKSASTKLREICQPHKRAILDALNAHLSRVENHSYKDTLDIVAWNICAKY